MRSDWTYRGRVRHEANSVPVPADVRIAVWRRWTSPRRACKPLGISEATATAILSPGGVVRADVLDRVKARLADVA